MAGTTIVGVLRTEMSLDSSEFQAGAARAQAAMGRLQSTVTTGANQTTAATAKMSGGMRAAMQQFSQVAQSGMATGNWIQALAIQIPDLALGFGTMGMAIGIVAGVGLPLLMNAFSGTADKAKVMTDALDITKKAVADYKSLVDQATASTADLGAKFGSAAPQVRALLDMMAGMKRDDALKSIKAMNDQIISGFQVEGRFKDMHLADMFDVQGWTGIFDDAKADIYAFRDALIASQNAQSGNISAQRSAMSDLLNAYNAVAQADGAITDEERAQMMIIAQNVALLSEQEAAQAAVARESISMRGALEAAATATAAISGYADVLAGKFAAAAVQARAMADAAAAASMSAPAPREVKGTGVYAPGNTTFGNPYAGEGGSAPRSSPRPRAAPTGVDLSLPPLPKRSGGGGGGESPEEKAAKQYANAVKSLNDEIAQYTVGLTGSALQQEILANQQQAGVTAASVQGQSIAQLTTELDNLKQKQDTIQQVESSLGSLFTSVVTGSGSAKDALANFASSMASMFAQAAFAGFAKSSGLSSILSGVLGGVGANANGTNNWRGGLSLVGERGPELINLSRGARVWSKGESQRMLAGANGGQSKVLIDLSPDLVARTLDQANSNAVKITQSSIRGNNKTQNARISAYERDPRVRG